MEMVLSRGLDGLRMHLLRMSCKCCALLEAAALFLLLSLLGHGAGTEAPAECEEPTHSRESCFAKRLSVNLEAVHPQQGSTKLKSMPVVWEACRSQLLSQGESHAVVANSFWCHLTLLARLQHGHSSQ